MTRRALPVVAAALLVGVVLADVAVGWALRIRDLSEMRAGDVERTTREGVRRG